jgi:hypothetical protein
MGMTWTTISVKRDVKDALRKFMSENNISSENDAIVILIERYNIYKKLDEIEKMLSEAIQKDPEDEKVFCKKKIEIKDVKKYIDFLKTSGKFIDWWEEKDQYCFKMKK